MRLPLPLLSLCIWTSIIVDSSPSPFPLLKGIDDTCRTENGEWECKRISECAGSAVREGIVCGSDEGERRLCCPPGRSKRAVHTAKTYCDMLLQENCGPSTPGWLVENSQPEDQKFFLSAAGGFQVKPGDYPEMALIGFGPEESKSWLCGGTLLNERFILTAAHCMVQATFGPAKWVRLGDVDYSSDKEASDPQDFAVVRRIPHPGFRDPAMYHDIALLELDKDARFSPYVRPLCLHTSPRVPFESVIAAGWGRTGAAEDVSSWLVEVNLAMVNHSVCRQARKPNRFIPKGVDPMLMVCAGWADGGRDTCQGDSGGPLIISEGGNCKKVHRQVGITSFGGICALPDSAAVYTRVSYYIPWIESIVWRR